MAGMTDARNKVRVLDLHFKAPGTIASFLLPTSEGPVLIETGPESTYGTLTEALKREGLAPGDIRHVLVTHIHLDHSGAAWRLAREGATVCVHPMGAPHMIDPSKLMASAGKIYGERMDELWGRVEGIPKENVHVVKDGEILQYGDTAIEALFTPGHATHHVAYRLGDAVFTGDVGGVRLEAGPVIPPCPPPDINVEDWLSSIEKIRRVQPRVLFLTHFGPYTDAEGHLGRLAQNLQLFAGWMRDRLREKADSSSLVKQFEAYTRGFLDGNGLAEGRTDEYEIANPAYMSVAGLIRYWKKSHPEVLPNSE